MRAIGMFLVWLCILAVLSQGCAHAPKVNCCDLGAAYQPDGPEWDACRDTTEVLW